MIFHKFNPNEESFTHSANYATEELKKSYEESSYAWPEKGNKLRITKSSLGGFKWCPQQYYFSTVLRLPSDETEAMVRGTNVHNVVEYFWKRAEENLDEIVSLMDDDKHAVAKQLAESFMVSPDDGWKHDEAECLDVWFNWQWLRFLVCYTDKIPKLWLPVGNEYEAHATEEIEVDGQVVPVHYKGYIDRIFDDGEGGFIIMELKTGKWVNRPYKMTAMRFEMNFYRHLLMKSGQPDYLPVSQWAWEFPNGTVNNGDEAKWVIEDVSRIARYSDKSIENTTKQLIKAHIDNEFPPIHSHTCKVNCGCIRRACGNCSFMHICPAFDIPEIQEELQ